MLGVICPLLLALYYWRVKFHPVLANLA